MTLKRQADRHRRATAWAVGGSLVLCLVFAHQPSGAAKPEATTPPAAPEPPSPPPTTPREYVNAGTANLRGGKLREAEAYLETALASQTDRFQPTALYNLGHVRFGQGIEELKKGPAAGPAAARGRAAVELADQSLQSADDALAANDIQKLVTAYIRGRGARKQLRDAMKAVEQAMQAYGSALKRWQRASGDFKSTVELNASDADARHNAEVVDRSIAKLVDSLQQLQQCAGAMGDKKQQLGEKMKQLRGRIPEENMPPGAAGDDEEEDEPRGHEPGQQEGPSTEGEEMELSPEQAAWLLDGFRLDTDRRLPMGQKSTAEPRDRNRPTW